jgi:N-acetylgalactosamine-6-sulfatase
VLKEGIKMINQKPNILFIFADDWGYGDLGCYGHDEIMTPNLDRLAAEGTRFTQFHVVSPVCSPSRCGVLTGHYPARHMVHGHFARHDYNAMRHMPNWLDVDVYTIPKLLKSAGYRTAHYGKWHLGGGGDQHGHPDAPKPKEYGYDDARGWNGNGPTWNGTEPWPFEIPNDLDEDFLPHSDRLAVDEAMKFIEADTKSPFYINLWLRTPHTPIRATEEQRKPYLLVEEPKQTYYAVITESDKQIGRILDKLDELGLTDNTLVVFSSDNGPESVHRGAPETRFCQGSTAGLRGRKRSLYEGGVRVPFIVKWPGQTPEGEVDYNSLTSAVDILPTFCNIAGVEVPEDLNPDGVNITDALLGKPFNRTKPIMWEWRPANQDIHSKECPMHAIRDGNYVLLKNPSHNRIELYNIHEDYSQLNNIAHKHPDVVSHLMKQLDEWTETLPDKETRPE